jgi:beta-galactosidase
MVYAGAWSPAADEARMADWPRSLGRVAAVERWGFAGDSRKNVPVEIYSNCDSVELLLNGRSLGEKKIADPLVPAVVWAVPNEAGTVEVVGKRAGVASARFQLKTVGSAERLELTADLTSLKNAGRQVATVEVGLLDGKGNRVPEGDPMVTFEVAGAGMLMAVGNADLTDGTPATSDRTKLYLGRAVAIVRSGAGTGKVTLRATSPGLKTAELVIAIEP